MKTISFKLMPYINGRGEVSEDYKELTLFVDGNRWCSDSVSVYNWEHMEQDGRDYLMFRLIPKDLDNDLFYKKAQFEDSGMYQRWYEHEFFIDGEDASEFIRKVPRSKNCSHFQSMCGVTNGWKYYKALKKAGFRESTAADLAYWRGYIYGMEWNSPFDHEGTEALYLMGLKPINEI